MLVNRTSLINSLSSELFSRRHRKALYEETQTVFSVLRRHFNVTKSENWQRHLTTKLLPYCQTAFRHYLCAQWWGLCRHNVPHSDCDIFVCLDGCCLRLGDCRSHKFLPLLCSQSTTCRLSEFVQRHRKWDVGVQPAGTVNKWWQLLFNLLYYYLFCSSLLAHCFGISVHSQYDFGFITLITP